MTAIFNRLQTLANQPAELHLFSEVDHFLFGEDNARVWGVMRDWLGKYFPARV